MTETVHIMAVDNTADTNHPNPNNYYNYIDTGYPYTWGSSTFTFTTTVYKYQIKCPKLKCKTYNWLELDKITPCVKCGAKLKAVIEQPDFEIEVNE